jgi:SM-20-related protein
LRQNISLKLGVCGFRTGCSALAHFKHVVWDDFLPETVHQGLLQYAIGAEDRFQSSRIYSPDAGNEGAVVPARRTSWICQDGLGPWRKTFKEAVKAREPELLAALGIVPFDVAGRELELAVHRDGSFFTTHTDLLGGQAREGSNSDRMISAVYYFHSHPKVFTGGELKLLSIGKGEPQLIEPKDNRLVAFPSIAPHAVQKVECLGNKFSDARFAVNCWIHKVRPETTDP